MWEVEVTDQFVEWWEALSVDQRESVTDRVDLLARNGPNLGRPVVDRISASRHHQHEGTQGVQGRGASGAVAFDPRRQVILLVGGDKTGEWDAWYEWAVPAADDLYDEYLDELRDEGLI